MGSTPLARRSKGRMRCSFLSATSPTNLAAKRASDIGEGWRYMTVLLKLREQGGRVLIEQDDDCLKSQPIQGHWFSAQGARGLPNSGAGAIQQKSKGLMQSSPLSNHAQQQLDAAARRRLHSTPPEAIRYMRQVNERANRLAAQKLNRLLGLVAGAIPQLVWWTSGLGWAALTCGRGLCRQIWSALAKRKGLGRWQQWRRAMLWINSENACRTVDSDCGLFEFRWRVDVVGWAAGVLAIEVELPQRRDSFAMVIVGGVTSMTSTVMRSRVEFDSRQERARSSAQVNASARSSSTLLAERSPVKGAENRCVVTQCLKMGNLSAITVDVVARIDDWMSRMFCWRSRRYGFFCCHRRRSAD